MSGYRKLQIRNVCYALDFLTFLGSFCTNSENIRQYFFFFQFVNGLVNFVFSLTRYSVWAL